MSKSHKFNGYDAREVLAKQFARKRRVPFIPLEQLLDDIWLAERLDK